MRNAITDLRTFTKNEDEWKNLASDEIKKTLEIIANGDSVKSGFERDKMMIDTILNEIKKTTGKATNPEEAALIYTLLLEEAKDLGLRATDKRFFKDIARPRATEAGNTKHNF